ncbi:TonB-dependent receptor [Comamonas sp.]|uniref:TonB-dependent receptor n=1 Tax=Comamonas sp. TaxID=34028 RepID=UPI00095FD876|nr:TonB-dependent receptor [Comamonas sp.]MBN9331514.1 TonB-dependent receptor [Comamonas sp.]OJX00657.1 MAG: TonB-dependent receptor [Burkholderiales bacterium 66-26]
MTSASRSLRPSSLRLATQVAARLSAAALLPLAAHAQQAGANAPAAGAALPTVTVQEEAIDPNPNAEVGAPYKARTSADVRHTKPLAETPATISVVTKSAIDDSGATDLKQILTAQPGITLGTGENGNMFGDTYFIRGQAAKSDVFVDGLRDTGMTTRESFAIEQVEISKGPDSSFAGRGTAGGAINAITKQATLDYDFTRLNLGLGSGRYRRATGDANRVFTDRFALRVNALYGNEDVPARAPSARERKGLALSGLWQANDDLSVTLDYYGLRAGDKRPDLGGWLTGAVPNRVPAAHVPVYAQADDFLQSDVDTVTGRIKYRFAPDLHLTSLTRYGTSRNAYAMTGANNNALDTGHSRWQDVDYFDHQDNLRWDTVLGGMDHAFIFGFEYTDHKVRQGTYQASDANPTNCTVSSRNGPRPGYCLTGPDGSPIADLGHLAGRSWSRLGRNLDWHAKTTSLYAMDTVDIDERWTAFGGVRADALRLSIQSFANTGANAGSRTGDYGYNDTLINGHLGLSYKITPQGMVYASYATSQDVNGGEPDAGTNAGYGGIVLVNGAYVDSKPERSRNFELGTKWNLLDDKLLFTAAAFQTTKSGVMEALSTEEYATEGSTNTGRNRVRGVEFGLVGNVTRQLTVQAGVAFMRSKVLQSVTPGNVGLPLANFANTSYSLQGRYAFTPGFYLGATVRHDSGRCGGQPDTGAVYTNGQCGQPVPGFTVFDLFGGYRFNKHASLRVNLLNAGHKDYYTSVYRGGFFLYKGDARALRVTLDIEL